MLNLGAAAETAALILSQCGGSMEKAKLLKIMYVCEVECIFKYGTPICADVLVQTGDGPCLEQSAAFIMAGPKNTYEERLWRKWFRPFDKDDPILRLKDCDYGQAFKEKFGNLFRAARGVIAGACLRFQNLSAAQTIEAVKSTAAYPELDGSDKGRRIIAIEDLGCSRGLTPAEIKRIKDTLAMNEEIRLVMDEVSCGDSDPFWI